MLQQTQVTTVIPYFHRWMEKFPDFPALAAAEESEVLGVWQGLGYYSRARNLHRAAKHVATVLDGTLPPDPEVIRGLPGVGRYTAGAVASFAFNLPEPLVDANVARVIARVLNLAEPINSTAGQRALWAEAEALVPGARAREFNGGLMELGAILCTARNPQCLLCPVRAHCGAFKAGTVQDVPRKKPRRQTVLLDEPCAWICSGNRVLLEQQMGKRWRGLWKLPRATQVAGKSLLLTLDYPFTHHRVTLAVYAHPMPSLIPEDHAWHAIPALQELPLAAPHRRALNQLLSAPAPYPAE